MSISGDLPSLKDELLAYSKHKGLNSWFPHLSYDTVGQKRVMEVRERILNCIEEPMRMMELAEKAGIAYKTLVKYIDRMECDHLVKRYKSDKHQMVKKK